MRWTSEITYPKLMRFVIEKEAFHHVDGSFAQDGYYIYSYENGRMIRDDLQDTLESAKRVTFKQFGVPTDSWSLWEQPYEWVAKTSAPEAMDLRIVHDLIMGFYVIVTENSYRINSMPTDATRWFPSLPEIQNYCLHEYAVPLDGWQSA